VSGIAMDVTESRVTARRCARPTSAATCDHYGAHRHLGRDLVQGDMLWDERQRVIYGVDARWRPDFDAG